MAHCQCTVRTWRGFAEDRMPVSSGSIYGIHRRRIAKSQWTKKATRGLWRRPLEVVSRGSQADPIHLQETRVAIEWFGKLVLKIELNWDHWPTIRKLHSKSIHESQAFLRPCSNLQAMHRDAGPHCTNKSKLVWMLLANLADF